MKTLSAILIISCLFINVNINAMPIESRVPGGIAILDLGSIITDENQKIINTPTVKFNNRKALVVKRDDNFYSLIPLSLKLKTNKAYKAKIKQNKKTSSRVIKLLSKTYPEQRIKIKNKRMVTPQALDMKRINHEKAEIGKARNSWINDEVSLDYYRPLEGKLVSKFGLKRFFNDKPRRPHGGIDVPAPTGTPVTSLADGEVVLTGNYYFNGKTVFINHGQGLVSFYCHLSEIDIKKGDIVNSNTVIGKVGATGRVTGPHLHFSIYMSGIPVDPELFVEYEEYKKTK